MAQAIRISYRASLTRSCLLALLLAQGCGTNRKESVRCPEPAAPQLVEAGEAPEAGETIKAEGEGAETPQSAFHAEMPAADLGTPSRGMVPMNVVGVGRGSLGALFVALQEQTGPRRVVPIFIGEREGQVIDLRLRGEMFERPLTHDLLDAVLRDRRMTVVRVEVDGLKDGTFLGRLFLADEEGRVSRLDARPSDCIALAVGAGAPVFVAQSVLDQTGVSPESVGLER